MRDLKCFPIQPYFIGEELGLNNFHLVSSEAPIMSLGFALFPKGGPSVARNRPGLERREVGGTDHWRTNGRGGGGTIALPERAGRVDCGDFRRRRKQGPSAWRRGGLRVPAAAAALPLRARFGWPRGPREPRSRSRCPRAPQRSAGRRRRSAGEAGRRGWPRAAVHRSAFLCLPPAGPELSWCTALQPQDG